MSPKKVEEIFKRLSAARPEPLIELNYSNPFELLVAVILSAQATDKGVNKITPALFEKASTPYDMVELGYDEIEKSIQRIGLFRTKAKNILMMSRILIEKHQGHIPETRQELEALPGVGRKTANIILNNLFGESTIAVDTHIFRISNRIGLAKGKNVREVEDQLIKIIPKKYQKNASHWLVLHGRYICKARKPECPQCIIADLCEFPGKLI